MNAHLRILNSWSLLWSFCYKYCIFPLTTRLNIQFSALYLSMLENQSNTVCGQPLSSMFSASHLLFPLIIEALLRRFSLV